MIRGLATVGGFTALSRVTGFGRDLIMAATLGAGPAADAFLIAFRLPNHFRAILAEGAFNAAFTPTYAALVERRGTAAADDFASRVLMLLLLANAAVVAPMLFAPRLAMALLAPGLDPATETGALAAALLRVTAPYLACLSVGALIAGALAARDRFAAAAFAPVLLNLLMVGALVAAPVFSDAAHAAAWGVFAAGFAQLALMLLARRGGPPALRPAPPRLTTEVREFLRRFGPAVLTSAAVQVAILADTMLASFLPRGALAHLYYADRLYQLPLGVVGVALGTVLLPDFARLDARGAQDEARALLGRALALTLAVGLPAATVFALAGDLTLGALFGRGAFDVAAVSGAAAVLAAYALGLPAALAIRPLAAAFQARGDLRTPLRLLAAATVVNVALKVALAGPLSAAGLALGTSAGVLIYAGALLVAARRRGFASMAAQDAKAIRRAVLGAVALAAVLLVARRALPEPWSAGAASWPAFALLCAVGVAALIAAAPGLHAALRRRGAADGPDSASAQG